MSCMLRRPIPAGPKACTAAGFVGPLLRVAFAMSAKRKAIGTASRPSRRMGRRTVALATGNHSVNGFEVRLRRWLIERTFAWLGRKRHSPCRDFGGVCKAAETCLAIIRIRPMPRRLGGSPKHAVLLEGTLGPQVGQAGLPKYGIDNGPRESIA